MISILLNDVLLLIYYSCFQQNEPSEPYREEYHAALFNITAFINILSVDEPLGYTLKFNKHMEPLLFP
jgi:hypothetical protein